MRPFLCVFLIVLFAACPVFAQTFPYHEDFEDPDSLDWALSGSWHISTAPETVTIAPEVLDSLILIPDTTDSFWPEAWEGSGCLVLSGESTGTYVLPWDPADQHDGTGGNSLSPHADTAETQTVQALANRLVTIRFRTWWEIESRQIGSADRMFLDFSNDSGTTYAVLDSMAGTETADSPQDQLSYSSGGFDTPGEWLEKTYHCSTGALGQLRLRFRFDTVDSLRNGFRGWFIDDLSIVCDSLYAPYGTTASDSLCEYVRTVWEDSSTADGILYSVGRRVSPTSSYTTIAESLSADSLAYHDTSAVKGTIYEYAVWGVTLCGTSGESVPDSGTVPGAPVVPDTVIVTDTLCGAVRLSWADSTWEIAYEVFRNDTSVADLTAGTESWEDTTTVSGVANQYRLGVYGYCDTVFSDTFPGLRRALPPDIASVEATDTLCWTVEVDWDSVSGDFSHYVVLRDGDSIGVVLRGSAPLYIDTPPESLDSHEYSVRTRNACALSVAVSDSGVCMGLPPSPDSCTATDELCEEIEVTWVSSDNRGVPDRFIIYRNGDSLATESGETFLFVDNTTEPSIKYGYEVRAWSGCGYSTEACADSGVRGTSPPLPAAIEASDTLCDTVIISWDAPEGSLIRFVVYRDNDSIGAVADGSPTVFTDTPADSMTVHTYSIRTRSACGLSSASVSDDGMCLGLPPSVDTCQASDSLCGRVRITWAEPDSPGHIERYVVYRGVDSVGVRTSSPFSVIDTTGADNVLYEYRIAAWSLCGYSVVLGADSGISHSAPSPPAEFTASTNLCGVVMLEWDPPPAGTVVWGYRLTRSTAPGWTEDLSADTFERVDVDSSGASEIVYTIRALNCEESDALVDTGRITHSLPSSPASGSGELSSCDSVTVSWSEEPGALRGYIVIRDGSPSIDSVGASVLHAGIGGLSPGGDYLFRIYSVNDCGRSATACTVSLHIPGPIDPPLPETCSATIDSCDGVTISWEWVSEEIEYFKVIRVEDGTLVDSLPAGVNSVHDTLPEPGDTLDYTVQAGNVCFPPAEACTVTGWRAPRPPAPGDCSASSDSCGEIWVRWYWDPQYMNVNILGFKVYRKREGSPQPFEHIGTVSPSISFVHYVDTTALPSYTYLYKVAAYDVCGENSGNCRPIGKVGTTPGRPSLLSPEDAEFGLELPLTLQWGGLSSAGEYRVVVGRNDTFDSIVVDTTVESTSIVVSDIEYNNIYYWNVVAGNHCGYGGVADVRSFSLGVAPGLEIVSGSSSFLFGDGGESVFEDSLFILQNKNNQTIEWSFSDTLDWIEFTPSGGVLDSGQMQGVLAAPTEFHCGKVFQESLQIVTNPLLPGRDPIDIFSSLRTVDRPAGDINWDCQAAIDDAGLLLDSILDGSLSTAAQNPGADMNGDEAVNIADAVLLGWELAADSTYGKPTPAGKADFVCAGVPEPVLTVSSGYRLRAVRLFLKIDDPRLVKAADPSRTTIVRNLDVGTIGLFWITDNRNGEDAPELLVVQADENGHYPDLAPLRVELLGVSGETATMLLDGRSVITEAVPGRVVLDEIRPNPFNAHTTVSFGLPGRAYVHLNVYNLRGACVATLVDRVCESGRHELAWNGTGGNGSPIASGVYFLRLESNGKTVTRRIVLLR